MKKRAELVAIAHEIQRREDVAEIEGKSDYGTVKPPYWAAAHWIYEIKCQMEGMSVIAKKKGVVLQPETVPTMLQRRVEQLEAELRQYLTKPR